jgi:diadenosine tetraphosphate (Ap4A) HIT family hydrolase
MSCLACSTISGEHPVPGGVVLENDHWLADHCVGTYGAGAFVAKTRAHRDSLWAITDEEAASLGPFLRPLSGAMVEGLPAERVYVTMWVDVPPHHVHFVLWPRYEGEPKGVRLQLLRAESGAPSPREMERAAARVRRRLAA